MTEPVQPRRCALDLRGLGALVLYFVFATLFLARGLGGRFSSAYIGKGVDPPQLMWLLAWWPHALAHGLDPFFTDAIWAPAGVNLTWTTCMPLLSLPAAPLVTAMGPVLTYNLACPLALALAAWCALALCRYVTGEYWPSLVGGYIFGFSAYMLGQALAHLDLLLVFPIPLFAWLLIRGFRVDISQRALVVGLVVVLLAQFLLFVELFATMTLFAAIAFIVMLACGSPAQKTRAVALLPTVAFGYLIALTLLSPYLYSMVALGYEPGAPHPPLLYSTDLLNLLVPTSTMELGRAAVFQALSGRFLGFISEAGGYLGIPLILVAALFAHAHWHERWARVLIIILIVAVVLSMGPFLVVAGRPVFALPGLALGIVPLIGKALPARLMVYAFLALALITALWLSDSAVSPSLRIAAALVVIASMLPNLSVGFWTSILDVPLFFREPALYTKYVTRGEIVVVLPYGPNGDSMAWQLANGWYFRMAGGYAGSPPLAFRRWPIVRAFYRVGTVALPDAGDQLKAFLAAHRATAVLVDDREADLWRPLMATLGVPAARAGGITIYDVPPAALAPWQGATALEMETRADRARFAALVLAADAYLRAGHSRAALSPAEVRKLGLMPPGWIVVPKKAEPPWAEGGLNLPRHAPDPRLWAGMWLTVDGQGRVEVGVEGRYPALRALLNAYRADSVDFSPRDLVNAKPRAADNDERRGLLLMAFDAAGLARAAAQARIAASSAAAGGASR